jgi:thiol-disulfide isomerase/thioredoxin
MKARYFFAIAASAIVLASCQQKAKTDKAQQEKSQEFKLEMTDFTMKSIDGTDISALQEVKKNKLTLIDFWASWCGPCRQEMPNVINIYNEYKDKGFGIIGVSLDQNEKAWKDAVEEMGLKWIQLSDLQGWNNAAARTYGVNAIPFTMIVDNNGYIVAVNLRGEQLKQYIAGKLND